MLLAKRGDQNAELRGVEELLKLRIHKRIRLRVIGLAHEGVGENARVFRIELRGHLAPLDHDDAAARAVRNDRMRMDRVRIALALAGYVLRVRAHCAGRIAAS